MTYIFKQTQNFLCVCNFLCTHTHTHRAIGSYISPTSSSSALTAMKREQTRRHVMKGSGHRMRPMIFPTQNAAVEECRKLWWRSRGRRLLTFLLLLQIKEGASYIYFLGIRNSQPLLKEKNTILGMAKKTLHARLYILQENDCRERKSCGTKIWPTKT